MTEPGDLPLGVTAGILLTALGRLLQADLAREVPRPRLSFGGKLTAWGIVAIGVVLVGASALDVPLGLPTFLCGAITAAAVLSWLIAFNVVNTRNQVVASIGDFLYRSPVEDRRCKLHTQLLAGPA